MEEALHLADRMTYMMTKGVVSAEEYGGGLTWRHQGGKESKTKATKETMRQGWMMERHPYVQRPDNTVDGETGGK